MITGNFGTKKFEVSRSKIYTPNGIGITKELDLEETEVSGKEPSVKVKGLKLTTVSFELTLSARFVDVLSELKFWESTLEKKSAKALTLGKWSLGDFYLTSFSIKNLNIGKEGEYTGAVISLSFTDKGYVAQAATTTAKTTTSGSTATKTTSTKITAKAVDVKSSNTNNKKTPRKGSTIKPKSGTRWYYTGEGAYKRTGKSGKAEVKNFTVYNVYKKDGMVVCVNADKKGWLRLSDITLVKY